MSLQAPFFSVDNFYRSNFQVHCHGRHVSRPRSEYSDTRSEGDLDRFCEHWRNMMALTSENKS